MKMNLVDVNIFLDEVFKHILGTFGEHYGSNGGVQLVDLFHSNGDGMAYARTSAMRYIMRFGKKDGYNKKDLMKAAHCICLLYYFSQEKTIEKRDVPEQHDNPDWWRQF